MFLERMAKGKSDPTLPPARTALTHADEWDQLVLARACSDAGRICARNHPRSRTNLPERLEDISGDVRAILPRWL
jgi:hypothetical protein